jgi:predicted PolB exonuclease-like 3'-5' exonuclease
MMEGKLKDILFIDLETVSSQASFGDLDSRMQSLWEKKAGLFRNEERNPEELYADKAAIFAEFGKVVCIGMGFIYEQEGQYLLRLGYFAGGDEKELLGKFATLLDTRYPKDLPRLCAHNGFEFDFPYLCRRMLVHGIPFPSALQALIHAKPWNNPHLDTLEMWKFGDRKNFTSLDLLAALFGVSSSKSDMDGSMVSRVYHEEGNLHRITEYCLRDVEVLARVYLKMSGLDISIKDVIWPELDIPAPE